MPRRCGAITAAALADVRGSRGGRYADVMVDRISELKLERGRIGLLEIDPRHKDYLPVNQYNVLRDELPDAELVFTAGLDARAALDPQRRGARLHPQGRQAVRGRHEGDGGARAARRHRVSAARRGRRRDPRRRRRHRLPDHRLDPDGQSRAWCSAIRARPAACCSRATSSTWSSPPAIAATPRRSARRSASARRPTW